MHPELAAVGAMFLGWQDLAEDVFGVVQFLFLLGLLVLSALACPAEQDGSGILDE